jgi:toxin ParE1/3/4
LVAREALADLDEIWSYYERVAGSNTAEKLLREISEVVTTVEDHQFVGRSRNELRPGFRALAASPPVVFYRVVDDVPEIVRVLDGPQDLDEIFARDTSGI